MGEVRVAIAPARGEQGIPMDVAGTLMQVIGLAYPNAKMGQEDGAAFVLIVSDEDRAPRTKVGQPAAAKAFNPRTDPMDDETRLIGLDGKHLKVTMPEELARHLAEIGVSMLASMEGATNYVEIPASHPEVGDVLITVARSKGQTPHALRTKAEGERDALARQIARLTDEADRHGCVTDARMRELLGDG